MKLCYIILSCFVLLLAVRPCCDDKDCVSSSAIVKQYDAHSSSPEKECKGCSPFFSCGTCVGFVLTKAVAYKAASHAGVPLKHTTIYLPPYIEDVALSIWQPPQLG